MATELDKLNSLAAVAAVLDALGETRVSMTSDQIESVLLRRTIDVKFDERTETFTFTLSG